MMENIVIRTNVQTPIYQQLYDQMASQIMNGMMEADSLLPSIRGFARELRVSIITIKKTWEMLEQNGLIYTIGGKGSYVQKNTPTMLKSKKMETVKEAVRQCIMQAHQMGLSQDEMVKLFQKEYNQITEDGLLSHQNDISK